MLGLPCQELSTKSILQEVGKRLGTCTLTVLPPLIKVSENSCSAAPSFEPCLLCLNLEVSFYKEHPLTLSRPKFEERAMVLVTKTAE